MKKFTAAEIAAYNATTIIHPRVLKAQTAESKLLPYTRKDTSNSESNLQNKMLHGEDK